MSKVNCESTGLIFASSSGAGLALRRTESDLDRIELKSCGIGLEFCGSGLVGCCGSGLKLLSCCGTVGIGLAVALRGIGANPLGSGLELAKGIAIGE